jgi:hypothetical protein
LERGGIHAGIWWERQKESGHMEDPEVAWRIILNFISDMLLVA